MNILFCTSYRVSEQKGGTERITARIAQGLRERGHRCYAAYKAEIDPSLPLVKWDGEINASTDSLENFILKYKIEIVIIQKMTREVKWLQDLRNNHHLKLKIFSVLHFNPGYEELSNSFHVTWKTWKQGNHGIKNTLRLFLFPLYKTWYPLRNKELYRTVYKYSDKVVLLSKLFVPEYVKYARLKEDSKFEIIPNALSFDDFLEIEKIPEKKKQILVVSRLDEVQKRISIAIRAWAEIEKDTVSADWQLKIVGQGDSETKYKQMIKELGLKRASLEGRQNPLSYYKESSIFFMTSAYEGWGLTLMEAQQFGCVPVAFNSYSSISDIIDHEKNGIIIENNNIRDFIHETKKLMNSPQHREELARQAIFSSGRYSISNIIDLWIELLQFSNG